MCTSTLRDYCITVIHINKTSEHVNEWYAKTIVKVKNAKVKITTLERYMRVK